MDPRPTDCYAGIARKLREDLMLRIASIGCGDIAQRRHIPQLQALPNAELVAVAARSQSSAEACAQRFAVPHFAIPRATTDIDSLLDDKSIDAVMILTAPDSHYALAERAIRAGKHGLIEKPLVPTSAEAAALLRCVQQAPNPITIFPLPHIESAEFHLLRHLIAGNAIGQVTAVESHRSHRGPTHADWFYHRAQSSGGVLIDLGIYQLTAIATLFGPATSMTAACTRRFATRKMDDGTIIAPDVEDSAMLTLALADGAAAALHATWNGYQTHHETRGRGLIIGREGILNFGVADGAVYLHRRDGDQAGLPPHTETTFDGLPAYRFEPTRTGSETIIGTFVEKILAGDTTTKNLEIQIHVLEIIEAAYATHATRLTTSFS